MQHGVPQDRPAKGGELLLVGQFAIDQEVRDLQEIAVGGELLDRIAAVAEDAAVAVEKGDRALRRAGVGVALVERRAAAGGEQLGDVEAPFAFGAGDDGEVKRLAVQFQAGGFGRLVLRGGAHNRGLSGQELVGRTNDGTPAAV